MSKRALITGTTGQDGSYLSEFLLEKGYEVHGMIRRTSTFNTERIDPISEKFNSEEKKKFIGHYGDLSDSSNINRLLDRIQPDEIYNLGAQSHVKVSFDVPEYCADVDGLGVLRFLDSIKENNYPIKFYQASTSELYGKVREIPQNESTPFYPRSPYAVAKQYAYWIIVNYREAYDLFACNGILFNHESPRRGETFVTRKITMAASKIKLGLQKKIILGNIDSKRDWGYAPEYVEAMWMMLQRDTPEDYVISTGETHSVREFIEHTFNFLDINIEWQGVGIDEVGVNPDNGKVIVEINPRYFRPTEVDVLIGDNKKAKEELGWKPKVKFEELVEIMVESDFKKIKKSI